MTDHHSVSIRKTLFAFPFLKTTVRGDLSTVLQLLGRVSLGLLCTLPSFLGAHPLAVCLVAAGGGGLEGLFTLSGSLLGCVFLSSTGAAVKYILSALLAYGTLFSFRQTEVSKQRWFAPSVALLSLFCMELVFDDLTAPTAAVLARCGTELGMAIVFTLLYQMALAPYLPGAGYKSTPLQGLALASLAVTVFCAMLPWELFHTLSVGRALALVLVMVLGLKGGCGIGAAAGLSVGLVMDLCCGTLPCYSLIFGLSASAGGLFARYGKLHFVIAYILTNACLCLLLWASLQSFSLLYEVFTASVILLILPSKWTARVAAWFPGDKVGGGNFRVRQYASQRVLHASDAFQHLYTTVTRASGSGGGEQNVSLLFDRAAENCCRGCKRSVLCWQQDYNNTLDTLNHLVPAMNSRGYLKTEDLPERFIDRCLSPDKLIAGINGELRSLQYRRSYRARLQEKLELAFEQYKDISQVLTAVAADLESESAADPYLEAKMQKYLKSQDVQASVSAFRDRNHRLHIEIIGNGLGALTRDKNYLEHLSHLAELRLCSTGYQVGSRKLTLLEAEPFAASVGLASARKNGQGVCGDKGTYFKTEEGFLYILLSDGMGTGEAAARCSGNTVHILEDFLRAGIAPDISLRILNNLMLLRCENDLTSATVDLLEINLFSGQATIYKYGAAPSYLVRSGKPKRIRSRSFSLGMEKVGDEMPDMTRFSMEDGDRFLMLSDGALSQGDDSWIMPALEACGNMNCKDTARTMLESVTGKKKAEDDITVLYITLDKRP